MKIPEICRYCGGFVRKGDTCEIHKKSNQKIYICTNCNAYVMCHKKTGLPMGKIANAVLRLKRQDTHRVFDSFWRSRKWSRSKAYSWLASSMNMPEGDAHIAYFEMDECEQVIKICREYEETEAT